MYAPWPPAVDLSSVNVAGAVPLSATAVGTFAHWTNTRIVFPAAGLTLQVTARLVPEPTAARLLFCPRVMATGQRAPNAACTEPPPRTLTYFLIIVARNSSAELPPVRTSRRTVPPPPPRAGTRCSGLPVLLSMGGFHPGFSQPPESITRPPRAAPNGAATDDRNAPIVSATSPP